MEIVPHLTYRNCSNEIESLEDIPESRILLWSGARCFRSYVSKRERERSTSQTLSCTYSEGQSCRTQLIDFVAVLKNSLLLYFFQYFFISNIPQVRHQNKTQKVLLPLRRFLTKTLRVIKTTMKSFSKNLPYRVYFKNYRNRHLCMKINTRNISGVRN